MVTHTYIYVVMTATMRNTKSRIVQSRRRGVVNMLGWEQVQALAAVYIYVYRSLKSFNSSTKSSPAMGRPALRQCLHAKARGSVAGGSSSPKNRKPIKEKHPTADSEPGLSQSVDASGLGISSNVNRAVNGVSRSNFNMILSR